MKKRPLHFLSLTFADAMILSEKLQAWYALNRRELPWRGTTDPYLIWVSEVILQQTRVAQGLDYYLRFTERFPDARSLAEASETEVLRLWQGLGYYSRARNMRRAAIACGGRFPSRYDELLTLPGVGDYTASAVSSFAIGEPRAAVDGNVYRVLARWFDISTPADSPEGARLFKALATEVMDTRRPGLHNQAMMEFGALCCTPASPGCERCPVSDGCLALARGTVAERPVKRSKVRQRARRFFYLDVRLGDTLFLVRREGKDIWRGLYEPPMLEQDSEPSAGQLEDLLAGTGYALGAWTPETRHALSHQLIAARFLPVRVKRSNAWLDGFTRVPSAQLDRYPLHRLALKYLERTL